MNTAVPPGDYKWIFGFATVNLVVATVGSTAVRRRFGDTAADTFQRRAGTVVGGVFTVWLAVFWGFIYAAVGAGLFLVSFLVERYRRQRAHTGKPQIPDAHPETPRDRRIVDGPRSTSACAVAPSDTPHQQ